MSTFVYPTAAELTAIAQELLPRLTADRPVFSFFPTRSVDYHYLMWEQMDNYTGLQSVRGLDGEPTRVKRVGMKRYLMQPGVYGEYMNIDETELTTRRSMGTFGTPIDISELVLQRQNQLLLRRLDRIEKICWDLLLKGLFAVSTAEGAIMHTDQFPIRRASAAVAWATVATATPLADMRAWKLLHRGYSVSFDRNSTVYVNQTTANNLVMNQNTADLFGRRTPGLATINNLAEANRIFMEDDLPTISVYDQGYYDDLGVYNLWIPDAVGVLVGQRPAGQVVGEYRYTRNVNNPDMASGAYMRVIDRGSTHVPRSVQVHDGHNGGPVIYYPSAVITLTL